MLYYFILVLLWNKHFCLCKAQLNLFLEIGWAEDSKTSERLNSTVDFYTKTLAAFHFSGLICMLVRNSLVMMSSSISQSLYKLYNMKYPMLCSRMV